MTHIPVEQFFITYEGIWAHQNDSWKYNVIDFDYVIITLLCISKRGYGDSSWLIVTHGGSSWLILIHYDSWWVIITFLTLCNDYVTEIDYVILFWDILMTSYAFIGHKLTHNKLFYGDMSHVLYYETITSWLRNIDVIASSWRYR